MLMIKLLRDVAGNGADETTWSQRYVDAESNWQQCCRVMLMTTLPRILGRGAI
jgi:hypothetical protein